MWKLTKFKSDIVKDYNDQMPLNEIAKKYQVSKSTVYRFVQKLSAKISADSETKSNKNKSSNDESNVDSETTISESNNDSTSEIKSNENNPNNTKIEPNNDDLNKKEIDEDEDSKSEISVSKTEVKQSKLKKINSNSSFNKMLNNIKKDDNNEFQEIKKNNDFKILNNLNNSVVSIKPTKKPIKNNQNTSFIHEIKCANVEELKKRRSNIIIIRQYLNTFDEQLKKIYGNNKDKYISTLTKLSNEQLLYVLEDIRVELSIKRNGTLFKNVIETGCITFEEILDKIFKINVKGCYEQLKKDNTEFLIALQILACEYDFSQYIDAKKAIFIKLLKSYHMKYTVNKAMNGISNIKINDDKLKQINEKFKNI